MAPREYDMTRRTLAKQETRQRILEATAVLHTRKGIFGTTYQDIAREADVSLATVYNHFPTLDELVQGCGGLLMERFQPPVPEDLDEILGDATDPRDRFERVAKALYEFYDRAPALMETDIRERELPQVRAAEEYHAATVASFAAEALPSVKASAESMQIVTALLDFPSFKAMRDRGVALEAAIGATVDMAMAILNRDQRGQTEPTSK